MKGKRRARKRIEAEMEERMRAVLAAAVKSNINSHGGTCTQEKVNPTPASGSLQAMIAESWQDGLTCRAREACLVSQGDVILWMRLDHPSFGSEREFCAHVRCLTELTESAPVTSTEEEWRAMRDSIIQTGRFP